MHGCTRGLAFVVLLFSHITLGFTCRQPETVEMARCMGQPCSLKGRCNYGTFPGGLTEARVHGICDSTRYCIVDERDKPMCHESNVPTNKPTKPIWTNMGCLENGSCKVSFKCPDAPKCELKGITEKTLTCRDPSKSAWCGTRSAADAEGASCVPHVCNPATATVNVVTTTACNGKQVNQDCTIPLMCSDTLCRPARAVTGKCQAGAAPQPTPMPSTPGGTMPPGTYTPPVQLTCVVAGGIPRVACELPP